VSESPKSLPFAEAIAAAVDMKRLTELVAVQTNDDMQAVLASRRQRGVPGGLGDSRSIRAAIQANVVQQITTYVAQLVATIELSTGRVDEERLIAKMLFGVEN